MLVLSRKSGQAVVIGGSGDLSGLLKVTVLGIRGAHVKLGFEVDAHVPVHRSEVWERINGKDRADLEEAAATMVSEGGPTY
jgi:carbon storage regulator CsrA